MGSNGERGTPVTRRGTRTASAGGARLARSLAAAACGVLLGASGCGDLLGGNGGGGSRDWIEWKTPAGRLERFAWFGTPAADERRVYLEADSGAVAFDRATGELAWLSPLKRWGGSRNTLLHDGALFAAAGGEAPLYSLDAATGAIRWERYDLTAADPSFARSAIDDRSWYVGTRDLRVLALDPATGATRWEARIATDWLAQSVVRGLSVSGDTVYAAAERCLNQNCFEVAAVIVALDRRGGGELWRWQSAGKHSNIMQGAVVAGRLLLGSDRIDNTFFAVDRFTGKEVWRARGERGFAGPYGPPVVADGVVYAGMGDTRVYAAELETGRVLWSARTGSSILYVAVCGDYVLAHNQALEAIDRRTGKHAGKPVSGVGNELTVSNIQVYGSRAYIAGTQYLYAIRCD